MPTKYEKGGFVNGGVEELPAGGLTQNEVRTLITKLSLGKYDGELLLRFWGNHNVIEVFEYDFSLDLDPITNVDKADNLLNKEA